MKPSWKVAVVLFTVSIPLTACDVISPAESEALSASGVVEAIEVVVASETAGRVTEVLVEESDAIEAGEPLLRLDDESLQIQRRQIAAAGKATNAALKLELIGAQQALDDLYEDAPLILAQAQLDLANAKDALRDAEYTWSVRQEGRRASPETVRQAEAKLLLADENLKDAKENYDSVSGRASDDPVRALALINWVNAQKARDAALRNLNWYTGHPTEIQQGILDADVAAAQARVDAAEAEWEKWKEGPDPDVLALAEARMENAEAQLEAAQAQLEAELDAVDLELDKYVVHAPASGVVITRNIEPGELILPGSPAMTIGQLDELTLTVYLPEDRYGQVSLGDMALATVDSYPGESFEAVVVRIADRAEFTPRNVQTEEDRRSTVYAIVLRVDDPDGKLKPGMPADVTFVT
ncbi:MAG: HlyD family secretion protein [Anaerolineales bacterium]